MFLGKISTNYEPSSIPAAEPAVQESNSMQNGRLLGLEPFLHILIEVISFSKFLQFSSVPNTQEDYMKMIFMQFCIVYEQLQIVTQGQYSLEALDILNKFLPILILYDVYHAFASLAAIKRRIRVKEVEIQNCHGNGPLHVVIVINQS